MSFENRIRIRPGGIDDLPFLRQMLFEAFYWNPEEKRPPIAEFLRKPEFGSLLANWGRSGDTAVIAEEKGDLVGAAWYRLFTVASHSYGFVDPETPEIGMAVAPAQRSRGIGRQLLRSLIDEARIRGIRTISLSVDPRNRARRLYESEGFSRVGESGTSWTMLLTLAGRNSERDVEQQKGETA